MRPRSTVQHRGSATGLTDTWSAGTAGCSGGVIGHDASPIIVGNTISGDVASAMASTNDVGYGGGVLLPYGSGLLQGNLIQGNVAGNSSYGRGEGVDQHHSSARVEGNRILSNTAAMSGAGYGGGIGAGQSYGATIVGNVIEGNRARASGGGHGGGIYQWAGNATHSGNRVCRDTGDSAVYFEASSSRFEGNVVLDNATSDGIYLVGTGYAAPLLVNDVVAHGGKGAAVAAHSYAGVSSRLPCCATPWRARAQPGA